MAKTTRQGCEVNFSGMTREFVTGGTKLVYRPTLEKSKFCLAPEELEQTRMVFRNFCTVTYADEKQGRVRAEMSETLRVVGRHYVADAG